MAFAFAPFIFLWALGIWLGFLSRPVFGSMIGLISAARWTGPTFGPDAGVRVFESKSKRLVLRFLTVRTTKKTVTIKSGIKITREAVVNMRPYGGVERIFC